MPRLPVPFHDISDLFTRGTPLRVHLREGRRDTPTEFSEFLIRQRFQREKEFYAGHLIVCPLLKTLEQLRFLKRVRITVKVTMVSTLELRSVRHFTQRFLAP